MKKDFLDEPFLDQRLLAYQDSDYYPFHMPGHKRTALGFPDPGAIDITEIDGFDNLHHAAGILKDAQERAARLYGAEHTFYLVNGSTCGILSALSAAIPRKGSLLMGRNCHKAAYHAAYLRGLKTIYLTPGITDFGILGSVSPQDVESALQKHDEISGVFLTSPTYDGIVSDVEKIAAIVHARNLPLIVDEAHGAHFSFSDRFPASALDCGADLVIQSLHKTLPCLTQTALLHVNSNRIPTEQIRQFLGIYQTSSPSYLFMASMERCIRIMAEDGTQKMADFTALLDEFYKKAADLKHLRIFPPDASLEQNCFGRDFSKILISTGDTGMTGQALYDTLLKKYHLQLEMVSGHYVTALTSVMDSRDGFERLLHALFELDQAAPALNVSAKDTFQAAPALNIPAKETFQAAPALNVSAKEVSQAASVPNAPAQKLLTSTELYSIPPQRLPLQDALEYPSFSLPLMESAGYISREFIYLYPPGIPLLAPGEEITRKLLKRLDICKSQGLALEGLADLTNQRINVVKI